MWNRGYITILTATLFFWTAVWMNTAGMPVYMRHLGFGAGTIGFVFSVGAISSLFGRLLSGWAIDYLGAKWFLTVGILFWVVTVTVTGFAHSAPILLTFRLVQGLGLALFTGAALGYVVYLVPAALRGTGITWWGLTNTVATAVAPLIATAVLRTPSFKLLFVIDGSVAASAFVSVLLLPKKQGTSSPNIPKNKPTRIVSMPAVLPGLVGLSLGFAGGSFTVFAPLQVQDTHTTSIGVYFSVYALGMLVTRLFSGRLSDKRGRSWVILPGLMSSTLGLCVIVLQLPTVFSLFGPLLFGFGLGAAVPGLIAWAVDRGNALHRSLSGNTYYLMYDIGMFVGPICVGSAMTERGFTGMFVSLCAVSIGLFIYVAWCVTQVVQKKSRQVQFGE